MRDEYAPKSMRPIGSRSMLGHQPEPPMTLGEKFNLFSKIGALGVIAVGLAWATPHIIKGSEPKGPIIPKKDVPTIVADTPGISSNIENLPLHNYYTEYSAIDVSSDHILEKAFYLSWGGPGVYLILNEGKVSSLGAISADRTKAFEIPISQSTDEIEDVVRFYEHLYYNNRSGFWKGLDNGTWTTPRDVVVKISDDAPDFDGETGIFWGEVPELGVAYEVDLGAAGEKVYLFENDEEMASGHFYAFSDGSVSVRQPRPSGELPANMSSAPTKSTGTRLDPVFFIKHEPGS